MVTRVSGFTLIEVCIIIALAAVLATVLYPVFAAARTRDRQSICILNQRRVTAAIGSFAQDNQEVLPTADQVWKQVELDPEVLVCPSTHPPMANSYRYSIALSGLPLAQVAAPQREMVTVDGLARSMVQVDSVSPFDPNTLVEKPLSNTCYLPSDVAFRHQGRFIACYLDGHAELTTRLPAVDVVWTPSVAETKYAAYGRATAHIGSAVFAPVSSLDWGQSFASSTAGIRNGYVRFRVPSAESRVIVGLGAITTGMPANLLCGFYLKDGTLHILECGFADFEQAQAVEVEYAPGDELGMERQGRRILFLCKGAVVKEIQAPRSASVVYLKAFFKAGAHTREMPAVTHAMIGETFSR